MTKFNGLYVLTDGVSELSTPRSFSSEEEINQAQEEAHYKSGGDFWWIPCQNRNTDKDRAESMETVRQSA